MNWNSHIDRIVTKASKRVTIMKRNQHKLPRTALEKIYIHMIRPILEYGNIIYDNTTFSNSHKLEAVQRRAAIITTGAYKHIEHQSLLIELGWDQLETRRSNHMLTSFYKIKYNLTPEYLRNKMPTPISATTHYQLRNKDNLRIPFARLTTTKDSFFKKSSRNWNNLPQKYKESPTLPIFKKHLSSSSYKPKSFNRKCTGKHGNWLTRLRLGLSPLNSHRFSYNFINDPKCPNCNKDETTFHYFFICPAYDNARLRLIDEVGRRLELDTADQNSLLEIFLFGKIPEDKHNILLEIITDYMKSSERFS
jgi:hypothetical protein